MATLGDGRTAEKTGGWEGWGSWLGSCCQEVAEKETLAQASCQTQSLHHRSDHFLKSKGLDCPLPSAKPRSETLDIGPFQASLDSRA